MLSLHFQGLTNDTTQTIPEMNPKRKYIYIARIATDRKLDDTKQQIASTSTSMIECAVLCSVDVECTGYVFSTLKGFCTIYNVTYEDLCDYIIAEIGSYIYKIKNEAITDPV